MIAAIKMIQKSNDGLVDDVLVVGVLLDDEFVGLAVDALVGLVAVVLLVALDVLLAVGLAGLVDTLVVVELDD